MSRVTPEEAYATATGRALPVAAQPRGAYVPARSHGGIVFVSGQTPSVDGEPRFQGRLGDTLSIEDGKEAARLAIGNALAALKSEVGALANVIRVLQLVGHVRCADDFTDQTAVIDGASEVLLAVFGEAGKHSRVAVGANALPRGVAVELVLVVAVAESEPS